MLNQDLPADPELEPGIVSEPADRDPASGNGRVTHGGLSEVDPWAYPTPHTSPRAHWPRWARGASETLEVIALALIMFMGVRMVVHNYVVDGGSMFPTFEDGQLVIVNRMAYRELDLSWVPGIEQTWRPFGEPARGDVIVFTYEQNRPRDFIKRVIGITGDEVAVRDGYVYVNGQALEEPYIAAPANQDYGPEIVPAGHVFVLGDNRNNSFDSRIFGMVDESVVIGRAELRYWPLKKATLISHQAGAKPLNGEVGPSSSIAR